MTLATSASAIVRITIGSSVYGPFHSLRRFGLKMNRQRTAVLLALFVTLAIGGSLSECRNTEMSAPCSHCESNFR